MVAQCDYYTDDLRYQLSLIFPLQRVKRAIEEVGSFYKWLIGVPDAEDLRILKKSVNEIIDRNNHQIKVKTAIMDRVNNVTKIVENLV